MQSHKFSEAFLEKKKQHERTLMLIRDLCIDHSEKIIAC